MSDGIWEIPARGRALSLAHIKAPTFDQGPSGWTAMLCLTGEGNVPLRQQTGRNRKLSCGRLRQQ
jgi:hypothetical protein